MIILSIQKIMYFLKKPRRNKSYLAEEQDEQGEHRGFLGKGK